MAHYEKEKWILYKKNLLSDEETIEMEDHLYTCDDCMDLFLSLIDSQELSIAENSIPINFTENIMEKIDSVIPITKSVNKTERKTAPKSAKQKKMIENIFMYYVAVASVVLVLTAGGVFTKMTEFPTANISLDSQRTNEGIEKVYSFSEKITNGTNNFINNIGIDSKENPNRKDKDMFNKNIFNKKLIKKQGGK